MDGAVCFTFHKAPLGKFLICDMGFFDWFYSDCNENLQFLRYKTANLVLLKHSKCLFALVFLFNK